MIFMAYPLWLAVGPRSLNYKEEYLQILKLYLITQLLQLVEKLGSR